MRNEKPDQLKKRDTLFAYLDRVEDIPSIYTEKLREFAQKLLRDNTSINTTCSYTYQMAYISRILKEKFLSPTKEDLIRVLDQRKDDGMTTETVNLAITSMKRFYTWLFGNETDVTQSLQRVTLRRTEIEHEETISKTELESILKASNNLRDKTLWSLLYDSGCRIGELQTLRIRDIEFKDYGLAIKVNGKTGPRTVIVLGDSIAYLREWLRVHPDSNNRDAYVLCEIKGKNRGAPMYYHRVQQTLQQTLRRAGITRRIHPHLFRHTRASILAQNVAEAPLEAQMGWVNGSQMARTYIHLSGKQQEDAILKAYGIQKEDKHIDYEKPKECPRCKELNPSNATQCSRCFLPFDVKLVPDAELLGVVADYKRVFRDMLFDLLEDEYNDKGDKAKIETLKKIRKSGIDLF